MGRDLVPGTRSENETFLSADPNRTRRAEEKDVSNELGDERVAEETLQKVLGVKRGV